MKTLAVINCKKGKSWVGPTKAELLYNSPSFIAMVKFVKHYYDEYVILSALHGVIMPTDVIEPYSYTFKRNGYANDLKTKRNDEIISAWADNVIKHNIWSKFDKIDFHISYDYWFPIRTYFGKDNKSSLIILPHNTGHVAKTYSELKHTDIFRYKDDVLAPIKTSGIRTYYHPMFGEFIGTAIELNKKFGPIDVPTVVRIGACRWNSCWQHKGWVVDQRLLKVLDFDPTRNMWHINSYRPITLHERE